MCDKIIAFLSSHILRVWMNECKYETWISGKWYEKLYLMAFSQKKDIYESRFREFSVFKE
jgi:hypothetical protein